jgi:hypothetical protein
MSRAAAGLTKPVTDRVAVTDTLYRYAALTRGRPTASRGAVTTPARPGPLGSQTPLGVFGLPAGT